MAKIDISNGPVVIIGTHFFYPKILTVYPETGKPVNLSAAEMKVLTSIIPGCFMLAQEIADILAKERVGAYSEMYVIQNISSANKKAVIKNGVAIVNHQKGLGYKIN